MAQAQKQQRNGFGRPNSSNQNDLIARHSVIDGKEMTFSNEKQMRQTLDETNFQLGMNKQ